MVLGLIAVLGAVAIGGFSIYTNQTLTAVAR
jgi:hypothetical protein